MNINPPKLVPHPNLVNEEGEEWIPGAIDLLSISTYGDEDECGHYTAPENYYYIGAIKGSTTVDVEVMDAIINLILFFVPHTIKVPFLNTTMLTEDIMLVDGFKGDYTKYQYMYGTYPDPELYWNHKFYVIKSDDGTGEVVGNACVRTFIPKQHSGPF